MAAVDREFFPFLLTAVVVDPGGPASSDQYPLPQCAPGSLPNSNYWSLPEGQMDFPSAAVFYYRNWRTETVGPAFEATVVDGSGYRLTRENVVEDCRRETCSGVVDVRCARRPKVLVSACSSHPRMMHTNQWVTGAAGRIARPQLDNRQLGQGLMVLLAVVRRRQIIGYRAECHLAAPKLAQRRWRKMMIRVERRILGSF